MPAILSGTLSAADRHLTGRISVQPGGSSPPYTGDYEVTPKIDGQTLRTAGKVMTEDLVISAVPYHEITNLSDGLTVHIAEEV